MCEERGAERRAEDPVKCAQRSGPEAIGQHQRQTPDASTPTNRAETLILFRIMSEYHVEKRRESAELTLVTGSIVAGVFFLGGASHLHAGPERVGDLMNAEAGFFPFESGAETMLINRAHVLKVVLPPQMIEAQLDAGYDVATRHTVKMLLTTGEVVTGSVVVFRPRGHERLSDYAHIDERFRYVELEDRTLLINSAHIVALSEVTV